MSNNGTPEVIPANDNGEISHRNFRHLIDAISHIEQLSVMELSGQDIPQNIFTLRDRVNFFHAGFGNGMIEGICFGLLAAIALPLASDPILAHAIEPYFPLVMSKLFLMFFVCMPLLIAFSICTFLCRYNTGKLTNRAVVSLLLGRSFSLLIKGVVLFVVFIVLHKYLTKEVIMKATHLISIKNIVLEKSMQRVLFNLKPHFIPCAYLTLYIFFAAMITPFFTTWLTSVWYKSVKKKAESFWLAE